MMADGCNDILERQFVWILGEACRKHGEQQMVVLRYIAARNCNIWLQKQNFFMLLLYRKQNLEGLVIHQRFVKLFGFFLCVWLMFLYCLLDFDFCILDKFV